jgi:hypothetical protein
MHSAIPAFTVTQPRVAEKQPSKSLLLEGNFRSFEFHPYFIAGELSSMGGCPYTLSHEK